jgi:hypothetical protein
VETMAPRTGLPIRWLPPGCRKAISSRVFSPHFNVGKPNSPSASRIALSVKRLLKNPVVVAAPYQAGAIDASPEVSEGHSWLDD